MIPSRFRVLIVDDNWAIHDDFRKVLSNPPGTAPASDIERELFGISPPALERTAANFDLSFASQGEEALRLVAESHEQRDPYSVAFVDVRMPPGIDGVETSRRMWNIDPDIQIVICSAYSDFSWTQMAAQLGTPDRWVILKKPFDTTEVLQLAHALGEKWRLRQQTRKHVAELEDIVVARTADLASALAKLREEVAERERSEAERREIERKIEETQRLESLGVLAGGVAHDFNNILTGILVSASMAKVDALPGTDLNRHLELIEGSIRRAAGLCEQMLAYAGRTRVESRPVALDSLVKETIELGRSALPTDAALAVEIGNPAATIRGDPARLRQVFLNILINAGESLAHEPRRVQVSTGRTSLDSEALGRVTQRASAAPGEFGFVEIADTGVGMPPETLRRIFEPFFSTKFTGRGLGLCAALGIVRSHSGAVDVRSMVGGGTTVRVYLPALNGA